MFRWHRCLGLSQITGRRCRATVLKVVCRLPVFTAFFRISQELRKLSLQDRILTIPISCWASMPKGSRATYAPTTRHKPLASASSNTTRQLRNRCQLLPQHPVLSKTGPVTWSQSPWMAPLDPVIQRLDVYHSKLHHRHNHRLFVIAFGKHSVM